jgi:8-oxo-dGTP pyrophosphatase MutT (NUDIX family)
MNSENTVLHHSCGLIVFNLDLNSGLRQFLLLKYPEGHIDFVKGHREDTDKSYLDTAIRELEEETGIAEARIIDGFSHITNYEYYRDGVKHIKRVDYFLAEVGSTEVTVSHEHLDFEWLPFDKAYSKVTYDNAKELLEKAEEFMVNLD